jgi:hypothetical protein
MPHYPALRRQACRQWALPSCAPISGFPQEPGAAVEVLNEGETKATATYVDGKTIQEAVRQLGPIPE